MIDVHVFVLTLLMGVTFVYLWDSNKPVQGLADRVLNLVALALGALAGQLVLVPLVFGG